MKTEEIKKGANYFTELSRRFRRDGIDCTAPKDDRLPVLLDGQEIGIVTPGGDMRIRREFIDEPDANGLYHRAGEVAAEVREYMTLMDSAPPLKASGLDMPYKQLADFNGYVLGGIESKQGIQFTTWQWTYDKDGLTLGHYCGNNYAGAKQDFAIRTGLVQKEQLFSPEQLARIYQCCTDTLDTDFTLSAEQEEHLKEIKYQIEALIPEQDLQSQNMASEMQQTME